ncbi:hypothetical protein [Campylobacter sp. 19-13652]|uniref:hypothetical protein n=1 Tax=Campylobacter sp. 19-13652 TaxID=2840180 RepID=UPI001C76AB9B|nr:hypothetical protein [Campylobacter sp. 19-13652]BCX78663.1 membrane protein [Campylobacter sp. 19-13652]
MRLLAAFFLAFFAFNQHAFAVSLLGYNVYERSDRVDVMLSFDAPYEGQIYSKRENGTTSLILGSLSFNENISKQLNSAIISELDITPVKNSLAINLHSTQPITVGASKTTDGFGLRIRVTLPAKSTQNASTNNPYLNQNQDVAKSANDTSQPASLASTDANTQSSGAFGGDDEGLISFRYVAVVVVLVLLLLLLLVFRKFIITKGGSTFIKRAAFLDKLELKQGVETIYERALDAQNRVVLLEFKDRQYLVIVGSTNLILDRFGDNIANEDEFSAFFEENKRRISEMLKQRQGSLENYKDKIGKSS